jgi:hypothetical protein
MEQIIKFDLSIFFSHLSNLRFLGLKTFSLTVGIFVSPGHCALYTQLTIRPWALCPLYGVDNPALGTVPSVRS